MIKPIAMRCNALQYEEIKPLLLQHGFVESDMYNTFSKDTPYLINNYGPKNYVLGFGCHKVTVFNYRQRFETWNKDIFLEYCDIKPEFVLPEKWCVEDCKEVTRYAQNRFNKNIILRAFENKYLCVDETKNDYFFLEENQVSKDYRVDQSDFIEINLEQFKTHVLKQKQMQTLTLGQLKDLYNVSDCSKWRENINYYLSTYLQRKDDFKVEIQTEHLQLLLKEGNTTQQTAVQNLGIKLSNPIEWDKIKTGSKVKLVNTGQVCGDDDKKVDFNKPFDVVLFNNEYGVFDNQFEKGNFYKYCVFHQNKRYITYGAYELERFITEVIEY